MAEDLLHGVPRPAERGEHAAGALRDLGVHLLQQGEELLVVHEDGELLLQLLLLAGLQREGLDLVHRVGEQVHAAQPLPLVAHELGEPLPQGGERRVQRMEALRESPPCPPSGRRACGDSPGPAGDWCSCCPCRSKSREENSCRSARVTGVDWMKSDPRPLDFSIRRRMTAPSSGSMPRAASHCGRLRVPRDRDDSRDARLLRPRRG